MNDIEILEIQCGPAVDGWRPMLPKVAAPQRQKLAGVSGVVLAAASPAPFDYENGANFHRSEQAAREVVADIQANGGTAVALRADVGAIIDVSGGR